MRNHERLLLRRAKKLNQTLRVMNTIGGQGGLNQRGWRKELMELFTNEVIGELGIGVTEGVEVSVVKRGQ